ncbi:hypothetical protein O181_014819 [Austropuccinia psidii MF-1]|uniref:Uncharacterized protein n=1 Tax=Austropuccinia psidii MF-1 TaxID=1389203 RepID=A0A9Q3GQ83_9BASI|nr:hypothetical protein [Austropuccinia psidii MF-1]
MDSHLPPSQEFQQMLISIMKAQKVITSSIGTLKEDVDSLKLSADSLKHTKNEVYKEMKNKKTPQKKLMTHKNKLQRAQSEPPPSKTPPKKLSKIYSFQKNKFPASPIHQQ